MKIKVMFDVHASSIGDFKDLIDWLHDCRLDFIENHKFDYNRIVGYDHMENDWMANFYWADEND